MLSSQTPSVRRRRRGRVIAMVLPTFLLAGLWIAGLFAGALFGWWRQPIAPHGDVAAFTDAARQIITRPHGAAAFVLIERGRIVDQVYRSSGPAIGPDTPFQVASLSKWITAMGVMTLVQDGRIDLDAPASRYLERWRLPDGPYNDQVTVRRLLSHTAGLTDDLGFGGFAPGKPVQPLAEALTHAADASPGKDGRVRVGQPPGRFRYSGGGYALLQLLIEDVTGESFDAYMTRAVFRPLGLTHTTFTPPADTQVAPSFDREGASAPLMRFSAPAAAGLYTSAADMARLVEALTPGPKGEAPGRGVLTPASLDLMRQPEASQYGAAIWGLGTILYAPDGHGGYILGHDGSNTPAINTTVRLDAATGDGIVVLETGDPRLATRLGGEWVFWKTGNIDLFVVPAELERVAPAMVIGAGIILLLGLLAFASVRRRSG